jgi:hypothetical protein
LRNVLKAARVRNLGGGGRRCRHRRIAEGCQA